MPTLEEVERTLLINVLAKSKAYQIIDGFYGEQRAACSDHAFTFEDGTHVEVTVRVWQPQGEGHYIKGVNVNDGSHVYYNEGVWTGKQQNAQVFSSLAQAGLIAKTHPDWVCRVIVCTTPGVNK
jgi:hypothetical protein